MSEQKNLILAILLSLTVLIVYQQFIIEPQLEEQRLYEEQVAESMGEDAPQAPTGDAPVPTGEVPSPGAAIVEQPVVQATSAERYAGRGAGISGPCAVTCRAKPGTTCLHSSLR